MQVFRKNPSGAPLIIVEAVWRYSHHILHGLMTKTGIEYSSLWSEDFQDLTFRAGLRRWLRKGKVRFPAFMSVNPAQLA